MITHSHRERRFHCQTRRRR